MNVNRLLAIDDQADIGEIIGTVAEGCGFDARVVQRSDQFWSAYQNFGPTVIVLDLQMPDSDGVELLRLLADRNCRAGILILSGQDHRVVATASRLGGERGLTMLGALSKPVLLEELESALIAAKRPPPETTMDALSAALAAKQFVAYYQPKVRRLTDGGWTIDGAEALVRWERPHVGLVMPDEFVPIMVEGGLIGELTTQVVTMALEQLRAWLDAERSLSVAVNLAPQLLSDLSLPDRFAHLVSEHGVPPAALTLEITESGVMADAAVTSDILTRFRLKGFSVSIDDFGTGYSSLVQLYRMPFNEMKIDKSFVMEMTKNEEARGIVRLLIELTKHLQLSACAEGVEDRETLDMLATLGCHKAQGYLFGKPAPAAEMEPALELWNG